ncbi:MAG: cell division protein FtsA, partial [Lachnospiraceae bacterium]|nr:cell division protein FtsA [Lachnospiraceae bacterium]
FPKRGDSLDFTVNGKQRMARGQFGETAVITVNGETADIYTPIHANDLIRVIPSTAGEKGRLTIRELPESTESLQVIVNDKKVEVPRFASVNGVLQSGYYEIQENDEIEILNYYTVGQILEFMDVLIEPWMNLYVNNRLADRDTPVYENFSVLWTREILPEPQVESKESEKSKEIVIQEKEEGQEEAETAENEAEAEEETISISVIVNNQLVVLEGKSEYIYVDVFERIDFDRSRPKGMGIVTTLNGRPAQYMEPIHDGDVLEIYWRS